MSASRTWCFGGTLDLALVIQQMRLDALAVDVHHVLNGAGIDHIFLKGPTTARWLYDPPRSYVDVDVLVAPDSVARAAQALEQDGLAVAAFGAAGEEASHSLLLRGPHNQEVDLHIALPLVSSAAAHEMWPRLLTLVEDFELDGALLPALKPAARGVLLALHALGSGSSSSQPREDLARAVSLGPAFWREVEETASQLGLLPYVQAAASGTTSSFSKLPLDAFLLATGSSAGAYQLARLRSAPKRRLPMLLFREALPTKGFMRSYADSQLESRTELFLAYATRWRRLGRALRMDIRLYRAARRARERH